MASSNRKHSLGSKLVCWVRSIPVHDTPEERVRQHLLSYLLGPGGWHRSLIGVEVSLKTLMGDVQRPVPRRRCDIVGFSLHKGALVPLLIIECKASMPTPAAVSQLNGYNFFVQAPALALAWPEHVVMYHRGEKIFEGAMSALPSRQHLQTLVLNQNLASGAVS